MEAVAHRVSLRYTLMFSILAVVAMACILLAAIGTYAVVGHVAGRHTREIGIRVALGAPGRCPAHSNRPRVPAHLHWRRLWSGTVGSHHADPREQLYNLSPLDPAVFVAGILIVTLTALLAGWVPAWRASRLSPLDALRTDGAVTHERNSMTRMESYRYGSSAR
jgi:hypothetical protein